MKKKFLGIIMSSVIALSMVACSSETADDTADTSSSSVESTDEDTKTLVMATNAEFPPYEYYENSEVIGIDVEIAKAICDELGYELEIEDIAFDSIIAEVTSGKADFGMAGMTVTEERMQSVSFSDSYTTANQVVIVAEDSDITSIDDLSGKLIGVQTGTTGDIYATDDHGDENIERYNKGAEAVAALSQGKIDAVIIDNNPASVFVSENEGLKILETSYAEEEYAIAISKDNTELLDEINTALSTLKDNGTLDEIVAKYIQAE